MPSQIIDKIIRPIISRRAILVLLLTGIAAIGFGFSADLIGMGGRVGIGKRQVFLICGGFLLFFLGLLLDLAVGSRHTGGWIRYLASENVRLGKFLGISVQLGLLVVVARIYRLENQAFHQDIMLIAFFGFLIHYFLPQRFRIHFFLLLSLVGIFTVFGFLNGAWLVGIGLVIIGICHLPVSFRIRVLVILLTGSVLAIMRAGWFEVPWTMGIWPILASMFMFRLIIYMYDIKHRKKKVSISHSLSYFFLLPNVVFPFFPVVDYNTFCRTYYDEERFQIYQRGVEWLFRGITHLVLYRFVYYYTVISPQEIVSLGDLLQFLVTNFLLYLRISGQFHVIVGMLHLFGFNLPETNHLYYLASSFSDVWRRINIYWKEFMQKIFFYPAYFKLRKFGNETALVLSTFIVFFVTWFLHSYQWFWLRGSFLFKPQDALFWTILAFLVVANLLYESRFGRKRSVGKRSLTTGGFVSLVLRTAATFATMCVLWSFWTSGSLSEWFALWSVEDMSQGDGGAILIPVVIGIAVLAGGAFRGRGNQGGTSGTAAKETGFLSAALKNGILILLLGIIGTPQVYMQMGERTQKIVKDLKVDKLSDRDATTMVRGYYEELTNVNQFNSRLWEVYMGAPMARANLWKVGVLRLTGNFLHDEPIPSLSVTYLGKPFTLNSSGMRDQEYETGKSPDTYRIALLGASASMGWGIGDGKSFESLLEERLNQENDGRSVARYEILNFSMGGYNSLQQLVVFENKALTFTPDALFFITNEKDTELSVQYIATCVKSGIDIPYEFLQEIVKKAGVHEGMSREMILKRLNSFGEDMIAGVYQRIITRCHDEGILPVWIFLPPIRPNFGPEMSADVTRFARESGFVILNLTGMYDDQELKSLVVQEWDRHPNEKAHKLIADLLFEDYFGGGMILELAPPSSTDTR